MEERNHPVESKTYPKLGWIKNPSIRRAKSKEDCDKYNVHRAGQTWVYHCSCAVC